MPVPRANVTETPAEVGAAASSSPNVCVVFGCSSKGPLKAPQAFGGAAWKTMAATFGAGPGPKAAAYAAAKTDADFIYIRLPATAVAGFTSTPDVIGMTGGASATVTAPVGGTAVDSHEVSIAFPTGGTVGTTGMHFLTTIDGVDGANTALLTATTITVTLDGQSYVVHLHTGDTITTGDALTFYTLPPSAAILPQTVTRAKAATTPSTSSLVAGATPGPVDAYEVTVKVVDGGSSDGTTVYGVTVSYTLDGGNNWSPKTALTGGSLVLLDGMLMATEIRRKLPPTS
jgi:hypothetical protein